jgi:SNF2 family DNA or RNA helicase
MDEKIELCKNILLEQQKLINEEFKDLKQPKNIINCKLKDHQVIFIFLIKVEGLKWLLSLNKLKNNGILADDMGTGKTLTIISFISFLFFEKKEKSPFCKKFTNIL